MRINFQSLSIAETIDQIKSTPNGLSQTEAHHRQQAYGKNTLPEAKSPGIIKIFIRQFINPLIYVLIAAFLVSAFIQSYKDAFFIGLVIVFNAILGTVQEWKAEKSSEELKKLIITKAKVKRDGSIIELDSTELVVGDLVFLESGIRVPADLRLTEINGLEIEESSLTGESVPVTKNLSQLKSDIPLSEMSNLAFAGTTVIRGRGAGLVTQIGIHTQIGQLAQSLQSVDRGKTPLIIRMEKFAMQLTYLILGAVCLIFIHGVFAGVPLAEVFLYSVALAVAAIPESLPIALTVVLSISSKRMSKEGVVVRALSAVESLGSCTYIATDKTGTLTQNRQIPSILRLFPDNDFIVEPSSSLIKVEENKLREDLEKLLVTGAIANEAFVSKDGASSGDPIDIALLKLSTLNSKTLDKHLSEAKVLGEIPYESENGFSAKLIHNQSGKELFVKGALEKILPFCSTYQNGNSIQFLDTELLNKSAAELSSKGLRVLAFASGKFENDKLDISNISNLNLVGLVAFEDPIREDAVDSIAQCKKAGIQVAMITGDNPLTAFSVGKKLGLVNSEETISTVVTGQELAKYEEDSVGYQEKIASAKIFARVTPAQKLSIVRAIQKNGNFVAVTGDGVNDAPALKLANIGVAMGSGSDLAKDISSIVVTKDDFTSIVKGIKQGRIAFENLRKISSLVLSTAISQILLAFLAAIVNLPTPLLPIQLLWLNLITNGIRDIGLSFETAEEDLMQKLPKDPNEGILNRTLIHQIIFSGLLMGLLGFAYWFFLRQSPNDLTADRNLMLFFFIFILNFHTFNCRSERNTIFSSHFLSNPILFIAIFFATAIHIAAIFVPATQNLLSIAPIPFSEIILPTLLALSIILIMEVYKQFSKRLHPEPK